MASKRIELRDKNGTLTTYIDNIVPSLNWEWNRVGGCGACNFMARAEYDGAVAGSFTEDSEIRVYIPNTAGADELWYSGYIDRIAPQVSGREENINVLCLGYVNQIKRFIVEDKTYIGKEISGAVKDIIDTYVAPNASIYSTAANYQDSGFIADRLYFNENAFDCINKLAEIAGKREWGVGADKAFFFKKRDDSIKRYFFLGQNISEFRPTTDFNPIITRIYLEGGEGYKARFSIANRTTLREEIVQNSSITTQMVGHQFARAKLKEESVPKRSYQAVIPKLEARLEATHPLGKAAVNIKIGINNLYDAATSLYDNGLKYDGGTESHQIEKIKYTLDDEGLRADLFFGPVLSSIADNFKKIEYDLINERNI